MHNRQNYLKIKQQLTTKIVFIILPISFYLITFSSTVILIYNTLLSVYAASSLLPIKNKQKNYQVQFLHSICWVH